MSSAVSAVCNPNETNHMRIKPCLFRLSKIAILALLALPLVALEIAAADRAPDADCAIMCDKCKTVWVSRPAVTTPGSKGGAGYTIYRKEKTMECKECESAVATFFKTGKLQEECKTCGSTMTKCEAPKGS
jgi:hypothetical protein